MTMWLSSHVNVVSTTTSSTQQLHGDVVSTTIHVVVGMKTSMAWSAQRYFPHLHYTVYCCAGHTQCAVNCVIVVVTWSDLWTDHHHSMFYLSHSAYYP